MLKHFRQKTNVTCGAAAFRSLISDQELISEKEAVDRLKTDKQGTSIYNVKGELDRMGIENNIFHLNVDWDEYLRWLGLNSVNRKLFLFCEYYDYPFGGKQGRPSLRRHAICVSNMEIFDPSEQDKLPLEVYHHTFSKKLIIKSMIIVDIK